MVELENNKQQLSLRTICDSRFKRFAGFVARELTLKANTPCLQRPRIAALTSGIGAGYRVCPRVQALSSHDERPYHL